MCLPCELCYSRPRISVFWGATLAAVDAFVGKKPHATDLETG